jgi:hypothetical protein
MGTGDDIPLTINESTHPAALVERIAQLEGALEIASKGRFRDDANRIAQLEAIKAAMDNELELDNERGSTWHILNDALAPKEPTALDREGEHG